MELPLSTSGCRLIDFSHHPSWRFDAVAGRWEGPSDSLGNSHMNRANAWKQSGRISLWRYTENEKNYPGWHINADATGCRSLLSLLDTLLSDGGARTVIITPPTIAQLLAPNNRGGRANWVAPSKLKVAMSQLPEDWVFPSDLDPTNISIGANWLELLKKGVDHIAKGKGDYSIGYSQNGSLKLWFWW